MEDTLDSIFLERRRRADKGKMFVGDIRERCLQWRRQRPLLAKWCRRLEVEYLGFDAINIVMSMGTGLIDQRGEELSWSMNESISIDFWQELAEGRMLDHILRKMVHRLVEAVTEPPKEPIYIIT